MHGLTVIAFIGSVFSPYYALARAYGQGEPTNHVAMNVALYGKPSRWAMTERGRASLHQSRDRIDIGASAMAWDGEALTITINETTAPLPSKLRGTIALKPRALTSQVFTLDSLGRHRWQPIAPHCDIVVDFASPGLKWHGTGYFDTNDGDEPLDDRFTSWTWSRFDMYDHARIAYDVVQRDGSAGALSLRVGKTGDVEHVSPLTYSPLPIGLWGVKRSAPADPGHKATLVRSLEDAPFYTRSQIKSRIDGIDAMGIHESLSLDRARAAWVRTLLPFRMPRAHAAVRSRVS